MQVILKITKWFLGKHLGLMFILLVNLLYNQALTNSLSLKVLVLDNGDKGYYYSVKHILQQTGIPYNTYKWIDQSSKFPDIKKFPLIIISAPLKSGFASNIQINSLINYVTNGGIILASQIEEEALKTLFGINVSVKGPNVFYIDFSNSQASILKYINCPEEKQIRLANPNTDCAYIYHKNRDTEIIARISDKNQTILGSAILRRCYQKGKTYCLSFSFLSFVLYPECDRDLDAERYYINHFEPGGDVIRLLVKAIYEEACCGHYVVKHTMPGIYNSAVIFTHDVDSWDAFHSDPSWGEPIAKQFADLENKLGITSTYFFTTKTFKDLSSDAFWEPEIADYIAKLGFDCSSHSVGHFDDMDCLPLGSGNETINNYTPLNPKSNSGGYNPCAVNSTVIKTGNGLNIKYFNINVDNFLGFPDIHPGTSRLQADGYMKVNLNAFGFNRMTYGALRVYTCNSNGKLSLIAQDGSDRAIPLKVWTANYGPTENPPLLSDDNWLNWWCRIYDMNMIDPPSIWPTPWNHEILKWRWLYRWTKLSQNQNDHFPAALSMNEHLYFAGDFACVAANKEGILALGNPSGAKFCTDLWFDFVCSPGDSTTYFAKTKVQLSVDFLQDEYATLSGELRISKAIIENQTSIDSVISFRSGYLRFHEKMAQKLQDSQYSFDASRSAPDVLCNYPYILMKDNLYNEETSIYEIPLACDDVMYPANVDSVVEEWKKVIDANAENNAITVILIHPSRGRDNKRQINLNAQFKLDAEKEMVEYAKSKKLLITNITSFGKFWRGRDGIIVEATYDSVKKEYLVDVENTGDEAIQNFTLEFGETFKPKNIPDNVIVKDNLLIFDQINPSQRINTLVTDISYNNKMTIRMPSTINLFQNYPNPFNNITQIKYELPNNSNIILNIYAINGQKIKTLINTYQKAGFYSLFWNGKNTQDEFVASGVYIYELKTESSRYIAKMLLLK